MKPATKILNERDKILFEKALKFYFFSRQQDVRKLNSELQARFRYSGQVAYSLIVTFINEGNLKIEYMDFLNQEIKTMSSLDSALFEKMQIKPQEIDEIELNQHISLKVYDEDRDVDLEITYQPETGVVKLKEA
ncbi:MAG: hypothetical protein WD016_00020 [Balneolaceae bacterium]